MPLSTPTVAHKAMAVACFALPGLALTLPSGYSLPALGLCLLGAMAWFHGAGQDPVMRHLRLFAWALTGLCALWTWDAFLSQPFKVNALDRPIKFALIWLALPAVVWLPPPARALRWGVWLGALGAAATAFWQVQVLGMDRAWGYTNAIQFGNLALLLAAWSVIWAAQANGREQWLSWAAVAAALFAMIASESRGGWWVSLFLLPAAWWLSRRTLTTVPTLRPRKHPATMWVTVATASLTLVALGTQAPRLAERTQQALHEAQLHLTTGESTNSVGQRLAHWRLAWGMGQDKPLTGWGEQGYQQEKSRRIDTGEAPEVLRTFQHAHNEWLDMWAKHGLLGVLGLLAVYLVPAALYSRTLIRPNTTEVPPTAYTVIQQVGAACGLLTVIGYLGFGMTQVMFAHNSSSIMYVFMNLLWLGVVLAPQGDGLSKKKPPEPES